MGSNGTLVQPSDPPVWRDIMQLVGRDLGQDDWGSAVNHVSFDSDTEFAHTIRNLGTGGALHVLTSVGGNAMIVDDTGVQVSGFLVTGDFGVQGNTMLGNASSDTLTVAATSTFNAPVTINSTLHVTGATTLDSTLGAGATTVTTLHATGAATLDSTLNAHATTVTTLHATGGGLLDSDLVVGGNESVTGTLGVTGLSTLGAVHAGATTTTTLSSSGLATLNSASVTTTLGVTGTSTLGVLNAGATGVSTLSTSGLATLNSLSVTGAASVGTTLGVTGTSTLGVLNAGATGVTTLAASSTITGSSTVQGTRLISTVAAGTAPIAVASGNNTVVPDLNVSLLQGHPASDFALVAGGYLDTSGTGQTKSGALTVQGTFSTEGNTNIGNGAGDALTVTGTATISSTLGVTGTTTLGATIFSTLTSTGTAAASGTIRLANGLAIKARNFANSADLPLLQTDASNNLTLGDTAGFGDVYLLSPHTLTIYGGGSVRIQVNGTGMGYFGTTPAAQQTVTGSRGGNVALASLLTALANYGIIVNSSTP